MGAIWGALQVEVLWKWNLSQPNIQSDLSKTNDFIRRHFKNYHYFKKTRQTTKINLKQKQNKQRNRNDGCEKVQYGLVALWNQEIPLALKEQATTYTQTIS